MSDLIDRQAAITQLSHNKNKGDDEWELAVENDIQTIWKLPPAQPQRTDTLKAEIKRMKSSFTTCINYDYYTGYMSALSAVEGYIAQWEGDTE